MPKKNNTAVLLSLAAATLPPVLCLSGVSCNTTRSHEHGGPNPRILENDNTSIASSAYVNYAVPKSYDALIKRMQTSQDFIDSAKGTQLDLKALAEEENKYLCYIDSDKYSPEMPDYVSVDIPSSEKIRIEQSSEPKLGENSFRPEIETATLRVKTESGFEFLVVCDFSESNPPKLPFTDNQYLAPQIKARPLELAQLIEAIKSHADENAWARGIEFRIDGSAGVVAHNGEYIAAFKPYRVRLCHPGLRAVDTPPADKGV